VEPAERDGPQIVAIGSALVTFPHTWRVESRFDDRVVVRSANGREQATIGIISLKKGLTFDEFCVVCARRVEAEKKRMRDGFIHPDPPTPYKAAESFSLYYAGGDKSAHRVFSAYLLYIESEVVTVYLEGLGIPLTEHSETFKALLSTLKRRKRPM
jgi:hypothetical protein